MSGTVTPLGLYASIYFDDSDRTPRRVELRLAEVTIDLSSLPMEWYSEADEASEQEKEK